METTLIPAADVKILLGRKPLAVPPPVSLSYEADVRSSGGDRWEMAFTSRIVGEVVRVYSGDNIVAACWHAQFNWRTRTLRLFKNKTKLFTREQAKQ